MEKIYFCAGFDNTKFWAKMKELKNADPSPAFRFEGPYDVSTYNYNGEVWEVWDNADYGIPSYMERIK